jgi:hypothetical protein
VSHEADRSDPFAADPIMNDRTPDDAPATVTFPVAVKITGEDTWPLAAVREDAGPCPCGMHEPQAPGSDALLSCAPGVVTRMSHERVRNGQWEDIPKYVREGGLRVHRPAVDGRARIQLDLEHTVMDLGAMFERNEDLRHDQEISDGLRRKEAEIAALLAKVEERGWHAIPEETGRVAA